ncbi:MAG: ribosomal protein S18-alanine N-acetyltransferase [Peptococcaceae bacterium]|nr:ribosomal protein S18-alanine N-acetyltransferase [Peptococcaceae bacterium]
MDRPAIRKMSEQDLLEVMSIEQESFPNPWSLSSFQSELRENELAHYYSLVFQGKVIGYMGYWVIYDEAHITNLAIGLEYRSKGWGEYLLRTIMYHCVRTGIARMTLEVRVSNEIALRLYHKLGFATMGVRPRYYSDNQEDALIMWVTL